MTDELLRCYEQELAFVREMGAEFARKYPRIASRLQLEEKKCEDPHVERLIEAFALLTARIRHKIDDEFPEITEALLNILYPHYLRPIPSMSVVQFELDPEQSKATEGYLIPRGTTLRTQRVRNQQCRFRTGFPVTLWPLEVTGAAIVAPAELLPFVCSGRAVSVLRLQIRCLKGRLSTLPVDRLRFYLDGGRELAFTLYELLFNNAIRVVVRDSGAGPHSRQSELNSNCISDVGFGLDEGLIPYTDRSFAGYRHLQEYFSFPAKFQFFDLDLASLDRAGYGERFELLIEFREFDHKDQLARINPQIAASTFRLGCTPIINLFNRPAEPIRFSQAKTEYRLVPDVHNQMSTEVFSIDRVRSTAPESGETHDYQPLYSVRHGYMDEPAKAFWYASRRQSMIEGDGGTEVFLSFADLGLKPQLPFADAVSVDVTCTNRDLPGKLNYSAEWGYFQMESGGVARIRCLMKLTEAIRPPFKQGLHWRLISHLALNHLSMVEGGCNALQEILRLYDFSDQPDIRRQIAGITSVSSRPQVARLSSEHGVVFCRGLEVALEFDETQYVGSGVFLLATVLERFLGLYTSINSFSELVVRTRQRNRDLKRWPPRAGEQILL